MDTLPPNGLPVETASASPPGAGRASARPARFWTVWAVPAAGLLLAIAVQVVAVVIWLLPEMNRGTVDPAALAGRMAGPTILIAAIVGTQVCFAAVTGIAAAFSPERFRRRLGWVRPSTPSGGAFPAWGWIVVPLGAWIPATLGLLLAYFVPWTLSVKGQIEGMWSTISAGEAVMFVGMIALLPGVIEESLFRGYMQRRLLQRWGPMAAVPTASAVFALIHMDPQTVVFAFPIGLWLGIISWKCGSVVPGMVAHAFINGSWNVFQILAHQSVLSERMQWGIAAGGMLIAAGAFVATIRFLAGGPTLAWAGGPT